MLRYKSAPTAAQNGFTGILLVNLGTPTAPTPSAVRRYLADFLADPRVVEFPRWLWRLILHGIILRIRPRRVAKVYQTIWQAEGSPLLIYSLRLTKAVAQACRDFARVELAMCYGEPNIATVLETWRAQGLQRVLVVPLYPQYSGTTSGAVFDAVSRELQRWRVVPELRFCMHYYAQAAYLDAIANQIRQQGRIEKLLFSFHGIPQRYVNAGDPYYRHCQHTAQQVASRLGLPTEQWQLTFQSRFGREPWLEPSTQETLQTLARQGTQSVHVIAPGFAVDCLETLEELAIQNREAFLAAGGKHLYYIPALNDHADHVALLTDIIRQHGYGWSDD